VPSAEEVVVAGRECECIGAARASVSNPTCLPSAGHLQRIRLSAWFWSPTLPQPYAGTTPIFFYEFDAPSFNRRPYLLSGAFPTS
jgi:hypothetical protein